MTALLSLRAQIVYPSSAAETNPLLRSVNSFFAGKIDAGLHPNDPNTTGVPLSPLIPDVIDAHQESGSLWQGPFSVQ